MKIIFVIITLSVARARARGIDLLAARAIFHFYSPEDSRGTCVDDIGIADGMSRNGAQRAYRKF